MAGQGWQHAYTRCSNTAQVMEHKVHRQEVRDHRVTVSQTTAAVVAVVPDSNRRFGSSSVGSYSYHRSSTLGAANLWCKTWSVGRGRFTAWKRLGAAAAARFDRRAVSRRPRRRACRTPWSSAETARLGFYCGLV